MAPHPYADFLHKVDKPARYTGGEVGSRPKAWSADVATVCLAFPDVYDIGMSHLGFKILYGILNDDPRTLAERCYAPWIDMERELRTRGLPLVSLESKRPLSDFDVVGFSLQFELTYTNILSMLELGGIPLRAKDRGEADPLVLAGGPVATHPEPITAFVDAIVIGDGEAKLTEVALAWKSLRDAGVPRAERLRALAKLGAVYVPSLYATALDPATGLEVVVRPDDATLPFPVTRSLVDLAKYPFPDESPTGGPEAIFDRMSIEIARGCTEGCRFCQAGMIYRPVRERDPEEIVATVLSAVEKSGQDEVSLTALSTADVSCIAPLIKKVTDKLTEKRISLGVSSLRAYGLEPELLDQLKRVRATGLTFAPEAGTQRMRDVINKNVTEEQLLETAERVFSRGWGKMKLYFICGLPTETDEDVLGIIGTGARALAAGKKAAAKGKPVEVTVSVSVHVPKPHTPFQWCALDGLADIDRKQQMLRHEARKIRGMKLKTHDARASLIEGIFARGDRRLADVLEDAYRNGARFDSWEDQLNLDVWKDALDRAGIEPATYLQTLPVSARLPWSHIDVGLEDGFLAREYRKALASRLSPPCGKVAGAFVHETNVEDALKETRRLVCYDCGVACDMTRMREERVEFLDRLGAKKRPLPIFKPPPPAVVPASLEAADAMGAEPVVRVKQTPPRKAGVVYRLWFEKTGAVALLGHLDLVRELPRVFRRVGVELELTKGFHPKPDMVFSPALPLGLASLGELCDVRLKAEITTDHDELAALLNARAPEGLRFFRIEKVERGDASVSKLVAGARYALVFARKALEQELTDETCEAFLGRRIEALLSAAEHTIRRKTGELSKMIDLRPYIAKLSTMDTSLREDVLRAGIVGDLVGVDIETIITPGGAARPSELAALLLGELEGKVEWKGVRVALVMSPSTRAETAPETAPAEGATFG